MSNIICKKENSNNHFDFYTIRTLTIWSIYILIILLFNFNNNYWKNLFGLVILILLITVSLGSIFIVYIYPKYIYVPLLNYILQGNELYIIDIIFHHIPLILHVLLMLNNYWVFSYDLLHNSIIISLIWIIVYLLFVNPFNIYFCKLPVHNSLKN